MSWSLLIRGGTVVDGTGAPRRAADVAVDGDRIAAVEPGLRGEAARVIDATGLVVAPGFIDAHSHSDLFYLDCPAAESKIRQGCTTEVVGMCSFSPAPVHPARREAVRAWAGGIGARVDVRWETFAQYLDVLAAARPSINVVHFVGHGALRLAAMGPEARPAGPDDL
ncbi:MAG TPA: amidohydrolase family protein, partial [Candidatus Binatia bacterium]|nr:amidohydrolase family protein [Candidatus Binatia bacterium]